MNWQPVSVANHSELRWERYRDHRFACSDTFAPLVFDEFEVACPSLPILFRAQGKCFSPIAVLGLLEASNVFVSSKGAWLAGYVPAYYRSHPFALKKDTQGQWVLCVDHDSGYVGKTFSESFVTKRKKLTKGVQQCFDFLSRMQDARQRSEQLTQALLEMDLFVSCKDSFPNTPLQHLYQVDEVRFNALSTESMEVLRKTGVLKAIYAHWVSLFNVVRLLNPPTVASPNVSEEIDFSFLNAGSTKNPTI